MLYRSVFLVLALAAGVFCDYFDLNKLNNRPISNQCKTDIRRHRDSAGYRNGGYGRHRDDAFSCFDANFELNVPIPGLGGSKYTPVPKKHRGYGNPCNKRTDVEELEGFCRREGGSLCYFRGDATVGLALPGLSDLLSAGVVIADCIPDTCVQDEDQLKILVYQDFNFSVSIAPLSVELDTELYCVAQTSNGRRYRRGRNKGRLTTFSLISGIDIDIDEDNVSFESETTIRIRCQNCNPFWDVKIDLEDRPRKDQPEVKEPRSKGELLRHIVDSIHREETFKASGCAINYDYGQQDVTIVCGQGTIEIKEGDSEWADIINYIGRNEGLRFTGQKSNFDTVGGEVVFSPVEDSASTLAPLASVFATIAIALAAQF